MSSEGVVCDPYDERDLARLSERGGDRRGQDSTDLRSRPARDRDRILYSTAFRRMAGKTQVVAVAELGMYHTRLTHSLKVAQLGRRMAERLRQTHGAPDPDVVEAACLAHDLGHPPFGHAGEEALLDAFDKAARDSYRGDVESHGGFEGNAQSLRILTRLAMRAPRPEGPGLDLTRATLDACSKYPWRRGENVAKPKKWGVYPDDREAMIWVRDGAADFRLSFEAQLMDWCDDVAYAVHDVMDFFRGGYIPINRLFRMHKSDKRLPDEAELVVDDMRKEGRASLKGATVDELLAAWKELGVLFETFEEWGQRRAQKAALQGSTSNVITRLMDGIGFTGEAPRRHNGDLVIATSAEDAELKRLMVDVLQHLIWYYVIRRPQLKTQQAGQKRIVHELFEIYRTDTALLPPDRAEELEEGRDLLRTVADHVASFTEAGAAATHARLTGVRIGSITDVIAE